MVDQVPFSVNVKLLGLNAVSVGALLGVTVTVKVAEGVDVVPPVGPLSVTVTVIVAVPTWPATGVKVSVPVVLGLV